MLPLLRHVNRVARAFLYTWGASVHVLMLALYLGWIPSSYLVHAYIRIGLSGLAGAGYIMSMIWLTVVLGFAIYSIAQRFTSPDDQPSDDASIEAFQAISRGHVPLYFWCACFVALDAVVNRPDGSLLLDGGLTRAREMMPMCVDVYLAMACGLAVLVWISLLRP
ncbi:hypothetical protein BDZ89DRAFT_1170919 [Hymenopellis radicata]|nr:hypothetical protein BDZ89DRAFT_1170919 [Hymenopellis radicata]